MDLIYCADGNARLAQIAIKAGFKYGAQLPNTIYHKPFFVDQDWKNPDRERYMAALRECRPTMATVLDWERMEQLDEVLDWADEAAQYVKRILIIPKVIGGIVHLASRIGDDREIRDTPIWLAYSVPSAFSGTPVPYYEFLRWNVHLLGGSPHKQMGLTRFLNVRSADGNMINKMAQLCRFWRQKKGPKGHFVSLDDVGLSDFKDANYKAFELSCTNIISAWNKIFSAKGLT